MELRPCGHRDPHEEFQCVGEGFLDGSGDENIRDPRLRTCGTTWVQMVDGPRQQHKWDCVGCGACGVGCGACGVGKFSDNSNSVECKQCPPGPFLAMINLM